RDRPLRVSLLRLREASHVCTVTMHHIASDGWSLMVFIRELAVLYEAFVKGDASPLRPLDIQYADYTLWQRAWLQDEMLQIQLDYWSHHLAGAPPVLTLPTDWPRPPVRSHRGHMARFHIDPEFTRRLHALCRESSATLFMTLLAGFTILLCRY